MSERRSELRERLFKLRSAASASPTGFAAISIEALNDVDAAARALESELALLRRAFDRAEQCMTRGLSSRRLSFRCSHCALTTQLVLDGLIQAIREAESELIKEQEDAR